MPHEKTSILPGLKAWNPDRSRLLRPFPDEFIDPQKMPLHIQEVLKSCLDYRTYMSLKSRQEPVRKEDYYCNSLIWEARHLMGDYKISGLLGIAERSTEFQKLEEQVVRKHNPLAIVKHELGKY